ADPLDHRVGVVRAGVVTGEEAYDLADPQFVELTRALQHDADPSPPVAIGLRRVDSEHAYHAGVTAAVPFEDLHGGRLARSVRTEQCEHLAPAHLEIEAIDRGLLAVRLA